MEKENILLQVKTVLIRSFTVFKRASNVDVNTVKLSYIILRCTWLTSQISTTLRAETHLFHIFSDQDLDCTC